MPSTSPDISALRVNGSAWAHNDARGRSGPSSRHRVNGTHWDQTGEGSSGWEGIENDDDCGTLTPRQREKSAVKSLRAHSTTTPLASDLAGTGANSNMDKVLFQEISTELAEMVTVIMESLQEVSPPQILEPAREQFAACSVSVPAPTLASIHTGLKNLRFVARDILSYITSPPLVFENRDTFDIGDLLQSVGDMFSGMAAKMKVELVLYHGDDSLHEQGQQAVKAVDFNPVYVKGNESALTYVLAHIVRQILYTARPGDSIELGVFLFPTHRPDSGFEEELEHVYLPTRCIIDIAHKFMGRDARDPPNLETTIIQRLLNSSNAELTLDTLFRPQCALGRACELRFTLDSAPPPHSDPSPTIVHGVAEQPRMSYEPTFDQLAVFAHDLKDKKFSVTVYTKELSSEPLLASLSSWGVDLAVVGNGESAPPVTPDKAAKGGRPFVFIDDDVDILRSQIQAANAGPAKRPAIHRVQSANHVPPRQSQPSGSVVTIVYFTSLDNFKFIREVIQVALYPFSLGSEIIIVPKPVGPRRLLSILYSAVAKPRVDVSFSPNASSLHSPSPSIPNGSLLNHSPTAESKPGSPRPSAGNRTNSDRSVRSGVKETLPLSPSSPSTEYFPNKFADNNPLTGIRIQDSDGIVQGIYFNPKVKSMPSSPGVAHTIPVADTFASMQALANAFPAEDSAPSARPESPLERIFHSRRNMTPQGNAVVSRLGNEYNVVPPIKVLVVDDNRINREICGKALNKIGVASDLAVNGLDALNKWRTGEFHMILMDIQMPVMGGLEATRQIRQEERRLALAGFPHGTPVDDKKISTAPTVLTPSEPGATPYPSSVVIVALTASRDEEDRVQALAAGCNDFLTKPVSTVWLHNKVTEWGSIKALQQWAPTGLPEKITESQIQRAKRVASGLVPPTERRTPSPGQSKRRDLHPDSVQASPLVPSAPLSGAIDSAASTTSWVSLDIPTPVTGGFLPRGLQASEIGQGLNLEPISEVTRPSEHETESLESTVTDSMTSSHETGATDEVPTDEDSVTVDEQPTDDDTVAPDGRLTDDSQH